jgi:hypothetical protein
MVYFYRKATSSILSRKSGFYCHLFVIIVIQTWTPLGYSAATDSARSAGGRCQ